MTYAVWEWSTWLTCHFAQSFRAVNCSICDKRQNLFCYCLLDEDLIQAADHFCDPPS